MSAARKGSTTTHSFQTHLGLYYTPACDNLLLFMFFIDIWMLCPDSWATAAILRPWKPRSHTTFRLPHKNVTTFARCLVYVLLLLAQLRDRSKKKNSWFYSILDPPCFTAIKAFSSRVFLPPQILTNRKYTIKDGQLWNCSKVCFPT